MFLIVQDPYPKAERPKCVQRFVKIYCDRFAGQTSLEIAKAISPDAPNAVRSAYIQACYAALILEVAVPSAILAGAPDTLVVLLQLGEKLARRAVSLLRQEVSRLPTDNENDTITKFNRLVFCESEFVRRSECLGLKGASKITNSKGRNRPQP